MNVDKAKLIALLNDAVHSCFFTEESGDLYGSVGAVGVKLKLEHVGMRYLSCNMES